MHAASATGVRFLRALLFVRGSAGVERAVSFYQGGLGLSVVRFTDDWAELVCERNFRISIKAVESSEAQLSVGYSPFLSFDVEDMDSTIGRCVQMGGHLDGPIQYPAHGKVATLRSPDGHMLGLYEASVQSR